MLAPHCHRQFLFRGVRLNPQLAKQLVLIGHGMHNKLIEEHTGLTTLTVRAYQHQLYKRIKAAGYESGRVNAAVFWATSTAEEKRELISNIERMRGDVLELDGQTQPHFSSDLLTLRALLSDCNHYTSTLIQSQSQPQVDDGDSTIDTLDSR